MSPSGTERPCRGMLAHEPTEAQRPALDELRAASAKAIDMLKSGCPKDLPSIPTGRLAAMEGRLQVMLAAVQTVRPALERFYQSLSDEQKARFNAIHRRIIATPRPRTNMISRSFAMRRHRALPTCRSIASPRRSSLRRRSVPRLTN
jgi:LTXXQ motif family protein